jgi:hypothetical protein
MIVAQHAKCWSQYTRKRKSPAKGRLEVFLGPSEYSQVLLLSVRMRTSSAVNSRRSLIPRVLMGPWPTQGQENGERELTPADRV